MLGDFSVKGKIVLITGGGSGIGLQFARLVHGLGARVLLADLRLSPPADQFVKDCELKEKGRVYFQRCDVRNWADLNALIQASHHFWGDVPDVYIPGAGVFEPPWSGFWEDTESDGYASVEINVSHPIKLTRLAIRALLGANKKGVVCIIASLAGLMGVYPCPLYCATKHAVVGFVKSMAPCEALEGVKVTVICPSSVKTPMLVDDVQKKQQYSVERGHLLRPEEVADAMLNLVQEAKYGGGTVMEITSAGRRVIPEWNVSPSVEANVNMSDDAFARALEPVNRALAPERSRFT